VEPVGARRPGACSPKTRWRNFKDLRKGTEINRNRDMDWVRTLEKKSSDRRIGVWLKLSPKPQTALQLTLTDEDGFTGSAAVPQLPRSSQRCGQGNEASLRESARASWAKRSSRRSTSR
jgi:hypothetical protein